MTKEMPVPRDESTPERSSSVSRRDFLHGISSAMAVAATPTVAKDLTARWNEIHASTAAKSAYVRKALDEHQWKTVSVLCDLIIPADDRSGSATDADAPACIDDWIDFYSNQDGNDRVRVSIFGGLAWLDRESQSLFGNDFTDASLDQQKQILDRIAWPAHTTREDRPWMEFFNLFRDLTVAAFFSSKMGVADLPYIGNTFNPNWTGCDPAVWATIEQRLKDGFKPIASVGPPAQKS
jgi:gluconate 2-dehydrogenase gamma chain